MNTQKVVLDVQWPGSHGNSNPQLSCWKATGLTTAPPCLPTSETLTKFALSHVVAALLLQHRTGNETKAKVCVGAQWKVHTWTSNFIINYYPVSLFSCQCSLCLISNEDKHNVVSWLCYTMFSGDLFSHYKIICYKTYWTEMHFFIYILNILTHIMLIT